jgi:hypothetical protein
MKSGTAANNLCMQGADKGGGGASATGAPLSNIGPLSGGLIAVSHLHTKCLRSSFC